MNRKETSGSMEVSSEAANELLEMAKTSKKPVDRAEWLAAYRAYRFTKASKKIQRKLAKFAELFRRLESAM